MKLHCANGIITTLGLLAFLPLVSVQKRAIDTTHSAITVRVFKTGVFSAFGHNHEISAPLAEGSVNVAERRVSLRVDATKLRVLDPEASEDMRAEIQKTMEGSEVLDSRRFPEILFASTSTSAVGDHRWVVDGNLSLHGATKPVRVDVSFKNGHYTGSATIKQSDFAIKPISIAGGTVKVKDPVRIEFDIVLNK